MLYPDVGQENECTSHKSILCAICVPKIIIVGGNLTKFCQKQFCTVFLDTLYFELCMCIVDDLDVTVFLLYFVMLRHLVPVTVK